ncbi:unnamed protein product [Alternaria alternata]
MASQNTDAPVYTLAEGRSVQDPTAQTVLRGSPLKGGGLALLSDTQLIETLAHFPRERIPERVVHAKAAGAWGEFEVTHDISHITSANFLNKIGKKIKVLARISTVAGSKGSSDTVRDIRGWALKFFTDEGNWDMVGDDLPVFFIRDPVKFPFLNRSHQAHPQTHVPDSTMFWDFHNNNQEGMHALMQLFGNRGVPESLRNITGYGVHTFKFGKPEDRSFKYVKIHFKPDAGNVTMKSADAARLAGEEPDYHVKDMFNAIENEAENYRWNIFDATRIWPHADYPPIPVGKLTLNKNPANYHQDVEQAAFSPSTLVPGIGPSADIMLQARMFSYPDAARYRVGPNYQQLPCNRAKNVYSPYQRDGPIRMDGNYGADPDYVRSSFRKIQSGPPDVAHDKWVGEVSSYTSEVTDEDFEQPRNLWALCKKWGDDQIFIDNLSGHMKKALPQVQRESIKMFAKVDKEIGERLEKALGDSLSMKNVDHAYATYGLQPTLGGGY